MLREYASTLGKFSVKAAFILGTLSVPFFSRSANAAELNVSDKSGTPYLRVDAPEGSSFDLLVAFNPSQSKDNTKLILSQKDGGSEEFSLTPELLKNGLVIPGVSLGEYQLASSSSSVEIKRVDVAESSKSAAVKTGDENLGPVAYSVGAAAVVGGAVAIGAGGNSLDIFSNGSGGSGASASRDAQPRAGINTASISDVDPNVPTPPGVSSGPSAGVNPAPGVGTGTSGSSNAETPTGGNPAVSPAPPVTNPMTPS